MITSALNLKSFNPSFLPLEDILQLSDVRYEFSLKREEEQPFDARSFVVARTSRSQDASSTNTSCLTTQADMHGSDNMENWISIDLPTDIPKHSALGKIKNPRIPSKGNYTPTPLNGANSVTPTPQDLSMTLIHLAPAPKHNVSKGNLEASWADFVSLLEEDHISTAPSKLARHSLSDWSSHSRQPRDSLPFLILFPSMTKEVR
ncbi:hypothetical protein BGX38DRAFT_1267004 [Terfezia claveryi]|nr:hypothetical protein BGX38DRAFT_1267004 [Terfezia claveryi]